MGTSSAGIIYEARPGYVLDLALLEDIFGCYRDRQNGALIFRHHLGALLVDTLALKEFGWSSSDWDYTPHPFSCFRAVTLG